MDRQFYFSVKAVVVRENQLLALYTMEGNQKVWDLPGGPMLFGETADETLKRKITEDLGVEALPCKLIDTWNQMVDEDTQITGIMYLCDLDDYDISLSGAHDGFEWIDIDRLPTLFGGWDYMKRMLVWNWDVILDRSNQWIDKIVSININKLVPNNLYLNLDKINKLMEAEADWEEDKIPPALVGVIDGEFVLIDGHSRTYIAYKKGMTHIHAIVKPIRMISGPEALYRKIHSIAKETGITHISKLEDRILSKEEHARLWVGYCGQLMKEIISQRRGND